MIDLHHAAAAGYTATAAAYVTGRPGYPRQTVDWLRGDLGLGEGRAALDLGSGTGKFLPYLIETGAAVTAVEPVAAMREQLAAQNPGVTVKPGTAEAIPFPDASFDAVVCAQAFHWFANERALAEIRRVLRPGGALGLIWNVRDKSVDWVAALTAILAPYEGDTPRFHTGAWRQVFPAQGFGPLRQRVFPSGHTGTPEAVIVDRMMSVSFIAALPEAGREAVAGRIRALIRTTLDLAGQSIVTFPYETAAYSCVRHA